MPISNRVAASPPPASATGGPPTGAAGGSLAGTFPNPTFAAGSVTTTEILDGTIANADVNAAAAIAYSKLNLATSILNADVNASAAIAYSKLALTGAILNADLAGSIAATKLAGAITDDLLLPGFWNIATMAPTGTWLAANGDPAYAGSNTVMTTGVMAFVRVPIPKTISPTKISIHVNTAGASLTSIATASVSGAQTSPASGAWTLTTSSMSGYAANGVVQVGAGPTDVIAYTAWSGTSMTVAAGGYTPNTVYANSAALTAINNGVVLYTSAGAFIAATQDNPGTWTSTGQKQGTLFPTPAAITGGAGNYVWVGINSVAGTPISPGSFCVNEGRANIGPSGTLTAANKRTGTAGTYTTGANNTLTPANLVTTNGIGNYWVGLS